MLGGSVDFLADQDLRKQGLDPVEAPEEYDAAWPAAVERVKAQVAAEHDEVRDLGGLYVVGTERHESRRIDNQLRGRSGRQGDPGESRFYLSLEDELMRLFKSDWVDRILTVMRIPDDVPIENKRVTGAIANAQGQVESQNFESRKNVLKYDDVMSRQREVIYGERREVLEGADLETQMRGFIDDVVAGYVATTTEDLAEEWDLDALWNALGQLYEVGLDQAAYVEECGGRQGLSRERMTEDLQADAQAAYDRRVAEVGDEVMRELERRVVLSVLDRKWREHLYEMDYLREGIYLRAYSQRDPLVEYQREGVDMFAAMMNGIKEESVGFLFNLEVSVEEDVVEEDVEVVEAEEPMRREVPTFDAPAAPAAPAQDVPHIRAKGLERPARPQRLTYSGPEEGVGEVGDDKPAVSATVTNEGDVYAGVGRNAECPCGSGKKFKKCHGAPGGPTGLTARANG
jgi:preprotein translocase subunit SecA